MSTGTSQKARDELLFHFATAHIHNLIDINTNQLILFRKEHVEKTLTAATTQQVIQVYLTHAWRSNIKASV